MIKKTLLAFCLILAFAVTANAVSPLTSDQVERVLSALEKLEQYTDKMDDEREQTGEFDADALDPEMFNRECALIYGYNAEAKKIIEAHGFTYKTWPETAGRVMKAFAFLAMQEEGANGAAEMKEALAQIEADPSMTPEQKMMMKQHMQSALQTAEAMMKAPKADVEVVKPYYDKFSAFEN